MSELPRCDSERAFSSSCVSLFARSLGVSEGELLWAIAPEINSSVEIAVAINKRMAGYSFSQASPIVGDGSRASTQMIETDSIEMSWGRVMARRVREPFFKCPNCDALYQVVRVEAGPETSDGEIACRVCGSPLAARDGEFVLKYFLLRAARRLGRGVKPAL
jgi:hypothetical protein